MMMVDTIHKVDFWLDGEFNDYPTIWQKFVTIINLLTGVTVINSMLHVFPGNGISGLVLIAESHAAIHTWPEKKKAWFELVTCGDPVALAEFKHHCHNEFHLNLNQVLGEYGKVG